jgi:N-acetyldiaminopimelate deacetylase
MKLTAFRYALHQIPEIAFSEHKTKNLIVSYISALPGFEDGTWKMHEFKHSPGVLLAYSRGEGSYRLFRADMDALPIMEHSGCDYSSVHTGMMHACGHDVHMAILMGLIYRIAKDKTPANLLFLFQPAEEGKGGAKSILEEGIIQQYDVECAIALHVASGMKLGTISSKAGIFFGIPQEFDVVFKGKQAHVAYPEQGINALEAALDYFANMQKEISQIAKNDRVIYHVGKMSAGDIRNIIPAECILEGTHRSLKREIRDKMNSLTIDLANKSAEKIGAKAEVELLCSYDAVVNNPALVAKLIAAAKELNISYQEAETAMTGEDFGFFTTMFPGLLFWLGSGCNEPLHSDKFLPNDDCMETGVALLHHLAIR